MAGSFGLFEAFDLFKGTGSCAIGLSAGYNYMLQSRVVLGVEADVTFRNTIAGFTAVPGAQRPSTLKEAVQTFGTVRARPWLRAGCLAFLRHGRPGVDLRPVDACTGRGSRRQTHDLTRLASHAARGPNSDCRPIGRPGSNTSAQVSDRKA